MKKSIILFFVMVSAIAIHAQNSFRAYMDTTRNFYKAGRLEDAHYAMLQMLQELDLKVGNEIMKLLPEKFDSLSFMKEADEVTANSGYLGSKVKRTWVSGNNQNMEFEMVSNSAQVEMLNSFFNNPLYRDGKDKLIKIQGFKAKMSKESFDDNGQTMTEYEIQIPLGSNLITFNAVNVKEADMMRYMNSLPLPAIVSLVK